MPSYGTTQPEFINIKCQVLTSDIQRTPEQQWRMCPSAHGPCSVFATSGRTGENGSTVSADGARLQTYGTAQGTNFILIIKANKMHHFSNVF